MTWFTCFFSAHLEPPQQNDQICCENVRKTYLAVGSTVASLFAGSGIYVLTLNDSTSTGIGISGILLGLVFEAYFIANASTPQGQVVDQGNDTDDSLQVNRHLMV